MKILILSSHTPSLFWFRMDMMQAMRKNGNEVIAAAQMERAEWEEKFRAEGIRYEQIYVERNGINPISDIKTFFSLFKLIKKVKPDKIFVYQAKTIIYGSVAAALLGVREIYPLIAGVGSVFLGDGLKNGLVRLILKTQYRVALSMCKTAFFQNEDDKELFVSGHMIRESKIKLIHGSGVNLEKFVVKPLPAKPAILFIGRLVRDKGLYEYLEVCTVLKRKIPELRCMLVGPFDTNPSSIKPDELQEYIDSGIIEYFGEQRDVRPFIEQCSVYVLPSYREGTPKSVLEAMAMGRAVVTTDAPGCRETVRDGFNGFLTEVRNVGDTAEKIEKLLTSGRLLEFGKNSREMCEQIFDVNKVNYEILKTMEVMK